jgi:hypothetical protein
MRSLRAFDFGLDCVPVASADIGVYYLLVIWSLHPWRRFRSSQGTQRYVLKPSKHSPQMLVFPLCESWKANLWYCYVYIASDSRVRTRPEEQAEPLIHGAQR